jgi:hypothetical protein
VRCAANKIMAKSINKLSQQILVISKKQGESLTQPEIDALNQNAAAIQPDLVGIDSTHLEDLAADKVVQDVYKTLCDNKIAFVLTALMPKTLEPRCVFRIGELSTPEGADKQSNRAARLGWAMYSYLEFTGITKWMESMGYIQIKRRLGAKSN